MTTSQYTKKIGILLRSIVIIYTFGCSNKQIYGKNNLDFCKSKYGSLAIAIPETKGHPINSGNGVEDSINGFVCSYKLEESQIRCKDGTTLKPSRDGTKYCDSKLFSMKELCPNGELRKYFNEEDFQKTCNQ